MNEIIEIQVLPVLKNSIDGLAKSVKAKIEGLGLSHISPTEENKAKLKSIRTDLRKEIGEFENQRKKIKEYLLKDYMDFEGEYKSKIKELYDTTDLQLKKAIDKIQSEQDQIIKDYASSYFEEMMKANPIQEIKFADIPVNYTNNKQVRASIDTYFEDIKKSLAIIKSYGDQEARLYAIWSRNGHNLVNAITTLNEDLAMEARVEKEKAERARAEELRKAAFKQPVVEEIEEDGAEEDFQDIDETDDVIIDVEELNDYSLKVKCTPSQLAELMEFLLVNEFDYDLE